MTAIRITTCTVVALACYLSFQTQTSLAFTTTAAATKACQKPGVPQQRCDRFATVLNSTPEPEGPGDEEEPQMPTAYVPPAPARNTPQQVAQRRMDPLMASLTRDTSNAAPDQPTQNVPFFGEIPADGTLLLLVPAVLFASLGFLMSIVIAVQSSDQIVESFSKVGDTVAQTAIERTNRVYDENTCRGFCGSPQQEDVDALQNFMESITRSAREGKQ
ncbi:unnamed protein product [Pseudo-nitzschia multistriata]|uniref:Transmembrane protein n=1 Tax=Pseudo-nitzschia multistriata TaxID=183589 RepID=A0A448Z7D1_9STRA|nr:unnamed protein product [Pseudo-nitzschia multistriata]